MRPGRAAGFVQVIDTMSSFQWMTPYWFWDVSGAVDYARDKFSHLAVVRAETNGRMLIRAVAEDAAVALIPEYNPSGMLSNHLKAVTDLNDALRQLREIEVARKVPTGVEWLMSTFPSTAWELSRSTS